MKFCSWGCVEGRMLMGVFDELREDDSLLEWMQFVINDQLLQRIQKLGGKIFGRR